MLHTTCWLGCIPTILSIFGSGLLLAQSPSVQPADPKTYLSDIIQQLELKWPDNRRVIIACHGHSVPAGYFVTPIVRPFDSYPHLLHAAIQNRYPTSSVEVIRTAIGGEHSEQGAERFAADVVALRPDVITIDYALNDRGIGLERASVAWTDMIDRAKKNGIKVILLTPTPDLSVPITDVTSDLAQHASQIRELAAQRGVALVDSYARFEKLVREGGNLSAHMAQPNHPNRMGHELVCKELGKWFVHSE